jgi:hypothetical protein
MAMFEHLAERSERILVTGPHRSGTTVAAQMIAADTGYRYVDELDFDGRNLMFFGVQLETPRVVVQCPGLLKVLVDYPPPNTLLVLMRRPLEEIHRSEERLKRAMSDGGGLELVLNRCELPTFGLSEGDDVAAAKYAYWDDHTPENSIEISYESLAQHWAFVEASKREDFHIKQTAVDAMTITSENELRGPLWMTALLGPTEDGLHSPSVHLLR